MIIMPVPKDIRTFKPKFFGPLTKSQAYSVAVSAAIAAVFFGIFRTVPTSIIMIPVVIVDAPILACGFIEVRNIPLWIYFRDVTIRNMFAPKRRPYKTENAGAELVKRELITYEYFDPEFGTVINKKGKRVKVKKRSKCAKERLNQYLKEHPEMKGIE